MKRLITFFAAAIMSVASYGQYNTGDISIQESNFYFGARLGIDFAHLSGDIGSACSRTGLTLGAICGVRVSEQTPICIESGIYYTERGTHRNVEDYKEKINLSYLELPVLIKYGFDLGHDMAILPYVGPYFSLGVGGRIKDNVSNVSAFGDNKFNRFDMGMKFGCGFEYNHLYIEAGYQLGIANIAKESLSTIHGNAWFINIGFNI